MELGADRTRSWSSPRTLLPWLVAILLVLGVGLYVGLHSPWGTKHPRVVDGTAMRANDQNDLVMFDAEDGTQLSFGADHIWWLSESSSGEGDPPCLAKPLRKAQVEIGYLDVSGPEGGARPTVVWVRCS